MKVTAWRIAKRKHAKAAFSGEGARSFGGRWNNPGTAIVYTAQSQSLAVLEMLVHLDSSELLEKYVLFEVGIDESLITHLDPSRLPRTWRADPSPARVRAIGDQWVCTSTSAVLCVCQVHWSHRRITFSSIHDTKTFPGFASAKRCHSDLIAGWLEMHQPRLTLSATRCCSLPGLETSQ